jgi:CheY-like chemotaxis protein
MRDPGVCVLVVDDDRAIRETLRTVLEEEGYTVNEASNGARALELLRASHAPYVVLLDLRMPELDGPGVLAAVAADERLSTQHAYAIITANLDTVPRARAALRGRLSVPVIAKPFDLDVVLDTVAQASARLAKHHGDGADDTRHGEQSVSA